MKLMRAIVATAITVTLVCPLVACGNTSAGRSRGDAAAEAKGEVEAGPKDEEKAGEAKPEESNSEDPKAEEAKPEQAEGGENALPSKYAWPENDLANMVPKPEFSVPIESVEVQDEGYRSSVDVKWTGATQDEVAKYVQAVKDAGFTLLASETVTDGYYNYVAQGPDSKDDSVNTVSWIGITHELQKKHGQKDPVPFTRVYLFRYLKDAKIEW